MDREFVLGLAARFAPARPAWRAAGEVIDGTRRQLDGAFATPDAGNVLLIAFDADVQRAGFAYVVAQPDFFTGDVHGHLSEIATVVDGSGAGSALVAACEAWSRERGYRYLSLNVNDANVAARRFYERHGYVPEYRHLIKLL